LTHLCSAKLTQWFNAGGGAFSFQVVEGVAISESRGELTRMLHKPVEQMGGRGVRKLENSELYDNQLRRPEPNRL
jgi:hypothetical protein